MKFPFRGEKNTYQPLKYLSPEELRSNHAAILQTIEATGIPTNRRLIIGSAAITLAGAETGLFTRGAHDVDIIVPVEDAELYLKNQQTPSGLKVVPNRISSPRFLSTQSRQVSSHPNIQPELTVDILPWFPSENEHMSFEEYRDSHAETFLDVACVSLKRASDYRRKNPGHLTSDRHHHNVKQRYDEYCIGLYLNHLMESNASPPLTPLAEPANIFPAAS